MCVLGVEGSEKKKAPPPEDKFWNSPKWVLKVPLIDTHLSGP